MEQAPGPNPSNIIPQALAVSIASGLATFISTLMSNLFIKPALTQFSSQLVSTLMGGAKSINTKDLSNNHKLSPLVMPPPLFPLPVYISVTPEGGLNISLQPNDFLTNLTSSLSHNRSEKS